MGLVDLEADLQIQDQEWHQISAGECLLPLSAEIEELGWQSAPLDLGIVLGSQSRSSCAVLLQIWIVGHQFVHMHDIRLCLGVVLYLVHHWSRFGKHKPGSSVGVAQFASLPGIGSPEPFTMMESNYSIWLSIPTMLAFGRGF